MPRPALLIQTSNPPNSRDRAIARALDLFAFGDVRLHDDRPRRAGALGVARHGIELRLGVARGEHEAMAIGTESPRELGADAAAGAGDDVILFGMCSPALPFERWRVAMGQPVKPTSIMPKAITARKRRRGSAALRRSIARLDAVVAAQDRLEIDAGLRALSAHGAAHSALRCGGDAARRRRGGVNLVGRRTIGRISTTRGKRYRFDIGTKKITDARRGSRHTDRRSRRPWRWRRSRRADDSSSSRSRRRAIIARSTRIATCGSATRPAPARFRSRPTAASRVAIKYGTASWVYGEELCAAHGDVVVARRKEARLLSLRRKQGSGFLSRDRSDAAFRIRSTSKRIPKPGVAESGRRSLRLRRRHEEDDAHRRARRQAVRERRRRPLRVPRRLGAGRQGADVPRTNRRQNMMDFAACNPSSGKLPRRDSRSVADGLDRRRSGADA